MKSSPNEVSKYTKRERSTLDTNTMTSCPILVDLYRAASLISYVLVTGEAQREVLGAQNRG